MSLMISTFHFGVASLYEKIDRIPRAESWFVTSPCVTFDVQAHLSVDTHAPGDDDVAHVAPRVGLLRVVDVDGEVGRGHGRAEAHPLGELVLPVTDLPRAEVDHLHRAARYRYTITSRTVSLRSSEKHSYINLVL